MEITESKVEFCEDNLVVFGGPFTSLEVTCNHPVDKNASKFKPRAHPFTEFTIKENTVIFNGASVPSPEKVFEQVKIFIQVISDDGSKGEILNTKLKT